MSIRGNVQPSILIQILSEKFGKEAELYAYEKDPKNIIIRNETLEKAKTCSACKVDDEEKDQPCSFPDESDYARDKAVLINQVKGFIPEEITQGKQNWPQPQQYLEPQYSGMKKKKHGFAGWFGKKSGGEPTMLGCKFGGPGAPPLGYARLLPPPLLPPVPPPPPYRYGRYPPAVYPRSPPYRITKPSKPYPYDFYEKKDAPKGNSAFHSFRDDNVNACTIM